MADLIPSSLPAPTPPALPAPNGGFYESVQQQQSLPPFNITESRPDGAACGLGFLCDEDRMANCTAIRSLAISYGFGDVHAGMSCPENSTTYQNCPVGSYCPSPVCNVPHLCCVLVLLRANFNDFSLVLLFDIVFVSAGTGGDLAVSRRNVLSSQGEFGLCFACLFR